MTEITGVVERITYYNDENGYTVLRLRPDIKPKEHLPGLDLDGLLTAVGNLPELSPGEKVRFQGDYRTHPKHGLQFNIDRCEKLMPVTATGIERYLGSGMIKGIGPQLAKRIVKHFKEKTLDIIEKDPQQLANVPGIGPERTTKIIEAWEEQRHIKEIMLFLHDHKISTNLAVKIYKTYGDRSLEIVQENPYQLEQDIYGVGFKTADRIAQDLGLAHDHPSRIEAGIVYAINAAVNEGHVYVPVRTLTDRAAELLEVDNVMIGSGLERLEALERVKKDTISYEQNYVGGGPKIKETSTSPYGDPIVYLTPFYYSEEGVAKLIQKLIAHPVKPKQGQLKFKSDQFSSEQQKALETVLINPVSILTGGPGTGKTTCLKALIQLLENNQLRYALASPTGRAAKRLSEATSRPSSTIHRLLGFTPGKGFQYHDKFPLKIDFLIVDEVSMLDLLLTYNLLKAIRPGTQVLFVGDVDQLPSVGAGDVLRDIIASEQVPVLRLTKIFRQAEGSLIIKNAHRINHGQMPLFSQSERGDFFLFPAEDAEKAAEWIVDLVSSRMPEKFGLDPIEDIQVLTPLYRGLAGVDALNMQLQTKLNPIRPRKAEHKLFGGIFRVGDKVMQTRNNYDKDVFNGDIGRISQIDRIEQVLVVDMDQDRKVRYDFSEADELVLAYAVSVHKSQGSEFPAVVMPILTQHYVMLQRNLIYTAITRAISLCVMVGNQKALRIAINNDKVSRRYSNLANRLMVNPRNPR